MKEKNDFNPIKKPVEEIFVPSFPTQEEIKQFTEPTPVINDVAEPKVEEIKVIKKPVTNLEDEITVRDIEAILNNASKEKKEKLNAIWNQISERYSNTFAIQILVNGNIVAVSDDAFIVELQDVGFCNRVMRYENYVKIIEIFNEFDLNIKDYICIPKAIWSKIRIDYANKYKTNPKPVLEDIKIGIKRRVIPSVIDNNEEDKELENIKKYFDEGQLKIVEE